MALYDPFYGVSGFGKFISRLLNRILIVIELFIIFVLYKMYFYNMGVSLWWLLAAVPGTLLAVYVVNVVLRWLWNLVMVFIYGTADSDDIAERYNEMDRRREQRKTRRLERKSRKLAQKNAALTIEAARGQKALPQPLSQEEKIASELYLMQHPEMFEE